MRQPPHVLGFSCARFHRTIAFSKNPHFLFTRVYIRTCYIKLGANKFQLPSKFLHQFFFLLRVGLSIEDYTGLATTKWKVCKSILISHCPCKSEYFLYINGRSHPYSSFSRTSSCVIYD